MVVFRQKIVLFSYFAQNIDHGYSLELPQNIDHGYSLEPPQ